MSFEESNTSSIHTLEDYFFTHIFSPESVIAGRYWTKPIVSSNENATKPLVDIYKREIEAVQQTLVRIQKIAIKAVLQKSSSLTTCDYEDFNILLKLTFAKNKAIFMRKIILGKIPFALQYKFQCCSRQHGKLQDPISRLNLFKSSLHYSASLLWNALSQTVISCNSTSVFKNFLMCDFKSEWTHSSCNFSMTLDYRWSTDTFIIPYVWGFFCFFLCAKVWTLLLVLFLSLS